MLLLRLSALLGDKDLAIPLFDAPRVDWTERRGAQGLASAKIKTGVMPGTSHRIVDNEALRERTIVVSALSADREQVGAAAHEQNRVLSDMADQLGAIRQFGESNSLREVRTNRCGLFCSHSVLPAILRARASRPEDSPTPRYNKRRREAA
jgi:hypothetical protein